MIESRSGFRLALKTAESLRVFGDFIRQEFQGDEATELNVLSFVHHTHPAPAELLCYSVGVGLLSSVAAWLAGATLGLLIAGVLLGSVIPLTLIVILRTNKRLLSPELDRRSVEAERLLVRWGRLHAVRSVLGGLALLLFLYLAIFRNAVCHIEGHGLFEGF